MRRARALVLSVAACCCAAAPARGIPAFAALSLQGAQTKAVVLDLGVQQAAANVQQRGADLHLAQIADFPHAVADYSLAPQAGPGTGPSTVEQRLASIGAGISLNDIVAAPAAIRSAAADLLAAQRASDAAMLFARENAVRLYYGALGAIALEEFRRAELTGTLQDRDAARLRARSGESPRLDVMRADVAVEQARADLAQASAQRADAVGALASATGVPSRALSAIAVRAPPPRSQAYAVDAAVARALAVRPEIAALQASIDARHADLAVARNSALPAVTATAGYASGIDAAIPVHGPSAAVRVDLPLASPAGSRIAIAKAQLDAVRAQLADARRTIALQVSAAVRDARSASQAARAAGAAREAAARALAAVELGYREGASSSLDIADARRAYVQASVSALVSEYATIQADALLEVLVP